MIFCLLFLPSLASRCLALCHGVAFRQFLWGGSTAIFLGLTIEAGAVSITDDEVRRGIVQYFEAMSTAPLERGEVKESLVSKRNSIRMSLWQSLGLNSPSLTFDINPRYSSVLEHPWANVRQVAYQIWPNVYVTALLYEPKGVEMGLPAIITPTGHYGQFDNAYVDVQKFCLNLARQGYVVLSTAQLHYEDLAIGVSHQTIMAQTNLRGLDLLGRMPRVDRSRIGVAGASGGGLQTEILAALDPRPRVASIVGFTCEYRTLLYPDPPHCDCNHIPGVLRYADHPEISAIQVPTPMQYVTMEDWTADFRAKNFHRSKQPIKPPGQGTMFRSNISPRIMRSNGRKGKRSIVGWPCGCCHREQRRWFPNRKQPHSPSSDCWRFVRKWKQAWALGASRGTSRPDGVTSPPRSATPAGWLTFKIIWPKCCRALQEMMPSYLWHLE